MCVRVIVSEDVYLYFPQRYMCWWKSWSFSFYYFYNQKYLSIELLTTKGSLKQLSYICWMLQMEWKIFSVTVVSSVLCRSDSLFTKLQIFRIINKQFFCKAAKSAIQNWKSVHLHTSLYWINWTSLIQINLKV